MTVGASWEEVTLEDHVDLVVGYAFKSSGYTDDESDVRLLRGDNVAQGELRWDKAKRWPVADYQRYEPFHLREGDIILAMDRPWISAGLKYARVKRKDTPSLLVQRVARLRGTESLKTDYLRCVIGSADFTDYVLSILTGVNIPHISAKDIKRFRFLLPPVATQERISRVITSYDDLIDNNTRRIEILEEMARRLYEEWFVQFRFPGHERVEFKESELGLIPEGWAVTELEEVVHLTMGQSPSSEFYNEVGEGLPFHQGVTGFGDYFPSNKSYCTIEARVANEGDILFSVRAPVGRINVAKEKIVIGRGVSALRSKTDHQIFLLSQLRCIFKEEDSMGNGAIFKAVTKKDMQSIKLLQPSAEVIGRFELIAAPLWRLIRILSDKNTNLSKQRDLLLPKLISGEIDVSDIPMPT